MELLSYFAEHFDLPILDWIVEHLHCGFLDAVMPVITKLARLMHFQGSICMSTPPLMCCFPSGWASPSA